MSKIAVISDVHANIHGLDLFFEDISKYNIDKIICLGDLVTKYFYPKEVVDLIKDNCFIVVKGNCDDLVVKDERYRFARSELGIDRLYYLDSLPSIKTYMFNNVNLTMFHSNKNDLESIFNPLFDNTKIINYKRIINDYNELFLGNKAQITLTGHTHQNYIALEDNNKINIINKDEIIIDNTQRAIINVGSIGEHNHIKIKENKKFSPVIDPYLTYCIIDSNNLNNKLKINIIKIPYKEKLLKVYFDYIRFQEEGIIKNYEEETNKIKDSLIDMGYNNKSLIYKRG